MPLRAQHRPAGYLNERAYQQRVRESLDRLYGEVTVQWRPFKGEGPAMYAPVVDIAVGPFAIQEQHIVRYDELLEASRPFVDLLIEKHNLNCEAYEERVEFEQIKHFNQNARCLLCIEIEESGSRKHCLGNLVNASALGRVGLLVARNNEMLGVFVRQRKYLHFLADVGKNTFKTQNVLVLTEDQFNECLAEARPQRNGR
jgi:hypothetical protein